MEKKVYSYEEVREKIQDGDIVFIRDKKGIWSKIIRFFTKSKFSHAGIAFWMSSGGHRRLMIVEAQGGAKRRIVNLSYHSEGKYVIIEGPKPWSDVNHIALDKLNKVSYGYFEALYVGIREFLLKYFDIKLKQFGFPGEICSEFIANVYGLPNKHISPQLLMENLLTMGQKTRKI